MVGSSILLLHSGKRSNRWWLRPRTKDIPSFPPSILLLRSDKWSNRWWLWPCSANTSSFPTITSSCGMALHTISSQICEFQKLGDNRIRKSPSLGDASVRAKEGQRFSILVLQYEMRNLSGTTSCNFGGRQLTILSKSSGTKGICDQRWGEFVHETLLGLSSPKIASARFRAK